MNKLLTALVLTAISITAQANDTARNLAIKHIKDAKFSLAQCPKGGCTVDQIDLSKEACSSMLVARIYAQQSRDKELYQIARDNVKNVCGEGY